MIADKKRKYVLNIFSRTIFMPSSIKISDWHLGMLALVVIDSATTVSLVPNAAI